MLRTMVCVWPIGNVDTFLKKFSKASFGDLVAELCILVRTHPCLARIMESAVSLEIVTVKTAFVTIDHSLTRSTKGRLMLLPHQLDDAIKRALKDANSQCAKCGQTHAAGGVSLMTCGSCRLIRYCSKECQKRFVPYGSESTLAK